VTPYPYQAEGVAWLAPRKTALLADEMGLGKTPQALLAAVPPVLVVCPAIARVHWQREAERWRGWTNEVTVVSYNGLENPDTFKRLTAQPWGTLILDEAHYLKSPTAQRTKNVLGKGGLAHHADRIWCLTGTPMPNHPGELWPMMYVLGATPLQYSAFVGRYCNIDDTGKIRGARQSAIPELKAALAPFCLRRKKEEVGMQLPPMTIDTLPVEAGDVDIETWFPGLLNSVNRDVAKLRAKIDDLIAKEEGAVRAATEKGQDISSLIDSTTTLRRYVGLQKVNSICDIVEQELLAGAYEKLVIFAWHKSVIEEIRIRLGKYGVATLYGGTDPKRRQRIIDDFQNTARPRIVACNIAAAGTAINLTAASQVIFAESDWVPGNNAQAAARCHRIGQEMPVNVRVAYLPGTLDEQIQTSLARKMRDIEALGLA
jgi:SWI/SNF-related matrix-associated actin-dependent regulator 1 of chromatin subfamily A